MGNKNSGPRPSPTALKVLRGTARADRLNPNEPKLEPAPDSFDTPPAELKGDDHATAEWSRVVPILRRVGLVSEVERSALIAMCREWARYLRALKEIATGGSVIESEKGPIVSPHVAVADKALTHCLKLWVELGLTPSGRSKMTALTKVEPPAAGKWAGML
jgi:P27 family predicted phage terminase small subunit